MDAFPDTDVVLIESGGDNLTLTFSPLLADRSIYVLDVSGGDKTPRKQGPGLMNADLLVINKTDLAPYVGADLGVMERDSNRLRSGPLLFTDCRRGEGVTAGGALAARRDGVGGEPRMRAPVGGKLTPLTAGQSGKAASRARAPGTSRRLGPPRRRLQRRKRPRHRRDAA